MKPEDRRGTRDAQPDKLGYRAGSVADRGYSGRSRERRRRDVDEKEISFILGKSNIRRKSRAEEAPSEGGKVPFPRVALAFLTFPR